MPHDIHSSGACYEIHRTPPRAFFLRELSSWPRCPPSTPKAPITVASTNRPLSSQKTCNCQIAAARVSVTLIRPALISKGSIRLHTQPALRPASHFPPEERPFTVDMIRDHRRYPHTQIDKKVFLCSSLRIPGDPALFAAVSSSY